MKHSLTAQFTLGHWAKVLMLACVAALPLAACAPQQQTSLQDTLRNIITTPPPPGPVVAPIAKTPIVANSVAAAQIALTTLEIAALQYTTLPECVPAGPRLCHDPVVKARIKEYDNYAFNAVMAARRGAGSLENAVRAITALQAILP